MTIPDHLITPRDWSAEALHHAAEWTGQPEGTRALVESKRYLAMHELIERLRAEVACLSPTEDEIRYAADQDWAGLSGATAWHLAERHGEGWAGIGAMMEAWRDAEVRRITAGLTAERDAALAELERAREVLREARDALIVAECPQPAPGEPRDAGCPTCAALVRIDAALAAQGK